MKTAPGVKELAQRELGQKTREAKVARAFTYEGTDPLPEMNETMEAYHERIMASRPVKPKAKPGRKPAPKLRALIPYAGKPKGQPHEGLYGVKPGPKKTKPGPKAPRKSKP